jgi:hypothetical protein
MHFFMPPLRRSRHPLVRVFSLLVGVALLGALLVFGLIAAGILLVGGCVLLVWRQWQRRGHPAAVSNVPPANRPSNVLEGEFVVIQQGRPVTR